VGSHANSHPSRKTYISLFFLLFECISFNTKSSICVTIPKEQNVSIQSLCFDMQCLLWFCGLQMPTISTFQISQLSNKNLSFRQKNTFVSLYKLCIWFWIIYLSQRGPSLISHYFFTYTLGKLTYHRHQKLTNFIGLFKICTKFVISWVCVVENISFYLYMF